MSTEKQERQWLNCGGGPTWRKIIEVPSRQEVCQVYLLDGRGDEFAELICSAPAMLAELTALRSINADLLGACVASEALDKYETDGSGFTTHQLLDVLIECGLKPNLPCGVAGCERFIRQLRTSAIARATQNQGDPLHAHDADNRR